MTQNCWLQHLTFPWLRFRRWLEKSEKDEAQSAKFVTKGKLKLTSACTSLQEDFLAEVFNCSVRARREEQLAIEDAPDDVREFCATDSDCQASASDESEAFAVSGSSCFEASDAGEFESLQAGNKRKYAERRSDTMRFLGKTVCVRACSRLLGVGQKTLQRLRNGESIYTMKSRPKLPTHPAFGFAMRGDTAEKWPQIVMYLWHVYHSAAEYMPDGVRHKLGKPQLPEAPFNCQDRDADDIERHVNGFLKRLQTYSSDIDVHLIGPGTFKGERRHLQHGNQTELFYEYLAFCEARNQAPCSYTTFIRVCNKVIGPHVRSGHLHFRKESEHSKCDVCVRLKQSLKFRHGRCEASSREANIRAYSMHILAQWLDRQVVQTNEPSQMQGHEDIDQCFSVQAALIARHTFDNPTELVQILDGSTRSEVPAERQRAWQKLGQVHCEAFKLDEAADWKQWVSMLGIRVKGLRAPEHGSS
eukprot:s1803_g12.t1